MKKLLLLPFILFFGVCFAQANTKSTPEQELVKLLDSTTSFSAKFQQKVITNGNKPSELTIGTMYSKKPNLFRWEIDKPYKNIILLNNDKLWNYDVDLEQVTIQKFASSKESTPFFLSGSSENLKQEYKIENAFCGQVGFKKSDNCFRLIPKIEGSSFQSIYIGFKNNQLSQMKMLDLLEQTTLISFSNTKSNIDINPKTFELKIPKGVDVIEN